MNKTIFRTGILLGILAILFGAFGAHGLENLIEAEAVKTFETGVKYQMYHALFFLFLSNLVQLSEKSKKLVFYIILFGVLLFSFSIYLLATNSLTSFDFKTIGFMTPIGGLLLVLGWIVLGYRGFRPFD